jgi:hypothetical protein
MCFDVIMTDDYQSQFINTDNITRWDQIKNVKITDKYKKNIWRWIDEKCYVYYWLKTDLYCTEIKIGQQKTKKGSVYTYCSIQINCPDSWVNQSSCYLVSREALNTNFKSLWFEPVRNKTHYLSHSRKSC